jgi:hypothetical protein
LGPRGEWRESIFVTVVSRGVAIGCAPHVEVSLDAALRRVAPLGASAQE